MSICCNSQIYTDLKRARLDNGVPLAHCADGHFLLASSALTGAVWDGAVWVFSALEDYQSCPNRSMIATSTASGVNDALWCVQLCVLIIISYTFWTNFQDAQML